jgi:hypothetical protein
VSFLYFHFIFYLSYSAVYRSTHVLFKAGKNWDGWFGSNELIVQVNRVVNVFEGLAKGTAQGLFLFNNAPSHQKRALDAISAWKMPKCVLPFCFPLSGLLTPFCTQIQKQAGRPAPMGHTCAMENSQLAKASCFISSLTTRSLAHSRGWKSSFVSTDCGQCGALQHSATTFTAPQTKLTATAGGYSFPSLISLTKSLICRSLLKVVVIWSISIPNTTVN